MLEPVEAPVSKMSVPGMVIFSALILFVLYGDLLGIMSEFPILTQNSPLQYAQTDKDCSVIVGNLKFSLPKLLFVFFNGGGVFNRIPDNNIEYALFGRRVGADPTQPWEDLNFLSDCFPYDCRGELTNRLDFSWATIVGQESYQTAMSNLLNKIRDKYNREHPQTPVDKLAIYMLWWPRSEDGFYKLKQTENTRWQLMAED